MNGLDFRKVTLSRATAPPRDPGIPALGLNRDGSRPTRLTTAKDGSLPMTPGRPTLSRRHFVAASGAALLPWPLTNDPADLILFNGRVHTVAEGDPIVEAIAIAGGKVLTTGRSDDMRASSGRRTRAIDLRGMSVLPGINDSHLHASMWGQSQPPFTLDLAYPKVKSIADVVAAVREAAATRKPGEWIQGRGWDKPYFAEGRAPTRQDLDQAAPNNPVLLTEFSGHAVWVNTLALEAAKITGTTVAPDAGVIVKDADGQPTGVLFEGAAGLVGRAVPPPTTEERIKAIDAGILAMLSRGITSATEPGLDPVTIGLYRDKAKAGRLDARFTVLLAGGRSADATRAAVAGWHPSGVVDPKMLRVAGVKLYADGIPTNNKTAWLREPYEDGGNGVMVIHGSTDEERAAELAQMIDVAHQAGYQVGVHATGDRSIDAVIDGYIAAMARTPRADPRHYIIHADLVSPEALGRMAAARIGVNFNPAIKFLIADGQVKSIGPKRAAYEWPFRTALDRGVAVASSSDAPVTDGNWLQGIATCVLREGKQTGTVSGPTERISLAEAIRTHTMGGAWQDFAEGWKGSLEPGKVADLCVLNGQIDKINPHDIPRLTVTMTIVGGRIVYQRS